MFTRPYVQLAGAVEYTDCLLQGGNTPPTSVLWPSRLGLDNAPIASLQRSKTTLTNVLGPSWMWQENTSTPSLQRGKTQPTSILWLSWPGVWNRPTASLQSDKILTQTIVLNMTLDDAAPVMLELWVTRSSPSLSSRPGPLWHGMVAPDRDQPSDQIEMFDIETEWKQMMYAKLMGYK